MNAELTPAQRAVHGAVTFYAESLGVTPKEAARLYRESQSTRDAIALLVLAQADPTALRKTASLLPP